MAFNRARGVIRYFTSLSLEHMFCRRRQETSQDEPPFVVRDRDVNGVSITLAPGIALTGRVTIELANGGRSRSRHRTSAHHAPLGSRPSRRCCLPGRNDGQRIFHDSESSIGRISEPPTARISSAGRLPRVRNASLNRSNLFTGKILFCLKRSKMRVREVDPDGRCRCLKRRATHHRSNTR